MVGSTFDSQFKEMQKQSSCGYFFLTTFSKTEGKKLSQTCESMSVLEEITNWIFLYDLTATEGNCGEAGAMSSPIMIQVSQMSL